MKNSFEPKEQDDEDAPNCFEVMSALQSLPESVPKKLFQLNRKKDMTNLHFKPLIDPEPILIVSKSAKDEYFKFWVVYRSSGIIKQPECSMMPFAITDKATWDYYQWLAEKCTRQALNPRVLAQYTKEKKTGYDLELRIFATTLADLILLYLPYGGLFILSDKVKETKEMFKENKIFETTFLNRTSKNEDLLSMPIYVVDRSKIEF